MAKDQSDSVQPDGAQQSPDEAAATRQMNGEIAKVCKAPLLVSGSLLTMQALQELAK
jgi:hypothetical protein